MTGIASILRSRAAATAVVLGGALGYPLGVLAADGWPHFPSQRDCTVPATRDGNVVLVLGTFDSVVRASAFLDHVRKMGYVHAEVTPDGGCERVKVEVPGYAKLADARNAAAEAARAGIHATLEQGP